MGERARILVAALRSPVLGRIELGFTAFSVAEWTTWIAIIVYAYERGGAAEAGVVAFIQLLPSLVVAPVAAVLGDRYPRRLVLTWAYLLQAIVMGLAALVLLLRAPAPIVYTFAALTTTAITLTRPLQASLLPEVVRTPDELTAANVASGSIEGAGRMAGPALASVLLGFGGPTLAFSVSSVAMLGSVLALLPLARAARSGAAAARAPEPAERPHEPTERPPEPVPGPATPPGGSAPGPGPMARLREASRIVRGDVTGGVRAIIRDRGLVAIGVASAAGWLLLGALDVFYAVLAIDVLELGAEGVGLLAATTGVGMLMGSGVAVGLVGLRRLAPAIVASAAVVGVAVAAVGATASGLVAGSLLVVGGASSIVLFVAGQTYTQRLARPEVRTRVFGVLEGTRLAMTALGALAVPALVALVGSSGALLAAGLSVPLVTLAAARTLGRAERYVVLPERELALLRGIPMFGPLAGPVLERLAGDLEPLVLPAGQAVITQGAPGDRYYIIERGEVEVRVDGRPIRRQGAGDGFGEIALLRDVPRTATVVTLTEVRLLALGRVPFLEAITGQSASRAAADRVATERLGSTG